MRDISKLLQIVYSEFKYGKHRTLCSCVGSLHRKLLINYGEREILLNYIEANRPSMFSSWSALMYCDSIFYWKPGYIKPRLKWLKKHIKKNKRLS